MKSKNIPIVIVLVLLIGIFVSLLFFTFNYFVIIVSLVTLSISLILMQYLIRVLDVKRLTIPGFFYLTYIAIIFIPSIFIVIKKPEPYSYRYFFAFNSVLLLFPLGIFFINFILKFKPDSIKKYFSKPILKEKSSSLLQIIFFIFFLIALSLLCLFMLESIAKTKTIPLFAMLTQSEKYSTIVQLREESYKLLYSPLSYAYALLRNFLFPLLVIFSFGMYLTHRERKWLLIFFVTLPLALFYAAYSGAKEPVVIIVFLLFFYYYIYKKGQIRKKTILISILTIFVYPLFVIVMLSFGTGRSIGSMILAIGNRLFYDPALTQYYYFEIFPYKVDFLYGRSLPKLAWLLGMEPFDINKAVAHHVYGPVLRLESIEMAGGFLGNFYADFGFMGVLLGTFLAGLVLQLIQIYMLRRQKTVANLSAYVFMVYVSLFINLTTFTSVLLSRGLILALLFLIIVRSLKNFLRISIKPK